MSNPEVAAAVAVGLGLLTATWARWRLDSADAAAWGWPMAVALACAPVVYPWYLLYLTPFLFSSATLPLAVWSFTVVPTYLVWLIARNGGRWVVPAPLMAAEYALPVIVLVLMSARRSPAASIEPAPPIEPGGIGGRR